MPRRVFGASIVGEMMFPDLPDLSPRGFRKKGLACWHRLTEPSELAGLDLGWYYNWRPLPKIGPVPGVEFVPMFWCATDLTPENLAAVKRGASDHVLAFNEPDMAGQANMTPEECLECWPTLMELDRRLGSPAPADWKWLDRFVPEARRRGYRLDFVCVHKYPDISDPNALPEIEAMLRGAHDRFGLPIWFTECGAADVSVWHMPQLAKPTPAMAHRFLAGLLTLLERLPFVERYAWFADRLDDEYRLGSIFDPGSSRLTPLGELFKKG